MKKIFTLRQLPLFTIAILSLAAIPYNAETQVLYGMTSRGGDFRLGAIISYNLTTRTDSVVWSFGEQTDGQGPGGNLVYDTTRQVFYGMTPSGGNYEGGVLFSFDPVNDSESVIWNFGRNNEESTEPGGTLVYLASTGLYYGTAYGGGQNSEGVIFTFNPVTDTVKTVWAFGGANDGQHPSRDLVYLPSTGLFYLMCDDGGAAGGYGALVVFDPLADTEAVVLSNTVVHNSGWGSGSNPIYNSATGLFYITTEFGGSYGENIDGDGTIMSFNPITLADSVMWNFGGDSDGRNPVNSLVYDPVNGLYYGLIMAGGVMEYGDGTIFSFDPVTGAEATVLYFNDNIDGENPTGNLLFNPADSLLYGMTFAGGRNGGGTIFSFNTITGTDSVLWNFGSGNDGSSPDGDLVFFTPANVNTAVVTIPNTMPSVTVFPDPSSGTFTIAGLTKGQVVETYNYLGQMISSVPAEGSINQLDISSQANGMYIVRIFNKDGTPVAQGKMIKAN